MASLENRFSTVAMDALRSRVIIGAIKGGASKLSGLFAAPDSSEHVEDSSELCERLFGLPGHSLLRFSKASRAEPGPLSSSSIMSSSFILGDDDMVMDLVVYAHSFGYAPAFCQHIVLSGSLITLALYSFHFSSLLCKGPVRPVRPVLLCSALFCSTIS